MVWIGQYCSVNKEEVVETRYDWFSSDELLIEDLIHVDGVRCFRV